MMARELSDACAASSSRWKAAPVPSFAQDKKIRAEESDEELFTVPDLEAAPISSKAGPSAVSQQGGGGDGAAVAAKVRRGRNPQDKEYRRHKRLLRNRVSAQQARERKKVYVNDLESRITELQDNNAKLEEKISTLINENTMLRKVLMSMRPKVDESMELQNDQSGKS